ncbi:TPA: 4'-phosphopantetheinyl transferase superfamily protein [Bacillus cereus]|nr:4'-phosphopantetheinyl transferase superfamily protein [Bacillus cereus]
MCYIPCSISKNIEFSYLGRQYPMSLSICRLPHDLVSDVDITSILHPHETHYYNILKFKRRMHSYILGRFAAKNAIKEIVGSDISFNHIQIVSGVFNHPVVFHTLCNNVQVSITHSGMFGGAISFLESTPMGVDLEEIKNENLDLLASQMTINEKNIICALPYSEIASYTILWTAKEALSKVLKTGLTTPFYFLEISELQLKNDSVIGLYKNYPQYSVCCFILDTYVCSIAYPKLCEINLESIKVWMQSASNSLFTVS